VQLAMWVALPAMLVSAGLDKDSHWKVYLPAVLGSFVVMGMVLFRLERAGYLRAAFLVSIGLIGLVQFGLWGTLQEQVGLAPLALLLFVFFCGFNVLEASQPSMVSRLAPAAMRGTAMGVYNTLQSLGFFVGGMAGGWLTKNHGHPGVFVASAGAMLVWLVVAWPMRQPPLAVAPKAP